MSLKKKGEKRVKGKPSEKATKKTGLAKSSGSKIASTTAKKIGTQKIKRKKATDIIKDILKKPNKSLTDVWRKAKEAGAEVSLPISNSIVRDTLGSKYKDWVEKTKVNRSKIKKWEADFINARDAIDEKFFKDYLTSNDAMMLDYSKETLGIIPESVDLKKIKLRNIVNFSQAGKFGWTEDPNDPGGKGTSDLSVKYLFKQILAGKIRSHRKDEWDQLRKKSLEEEMDKINTQGMSREDVRKVRDKLNRQMSTILAKEKKEIYDKAERIKIKLFQQINAGKLDNRTEYLLGENLLERCMGPAYASSSKTDRGKTRMLAEKGEIFSNAILNIPFLLHNPPKRLQGQGSNLAKPLPKLINPEEPIVKGKRSDIEGLNLRTRMAKTPYEEVITTDAGIIITEDAAKRFEYFISKEKGTLIADSPTKFIATWRTNALHIDKPELYDKYLRKALTIQRNDPIHANGLSDYSLDSDPTYRRAKSAGKLVFIGPVGKQKRRTLTVDPDKHPSGKSKIEIEYYTQDFEIVRKERLKVGDKLQSRNGLRSVIADVVDDLGVDKNGKKIDIVVNYTEVWKEPIGDPNSAEYKRKDIVLKRQAKKKAGQVLEHKSGDGKIFFFAIDKFAQDQTSEGLRMSTTMLGAMWEHYYYDATKGKKSISSKEMDQIMDSFVDKYLGTPGYFARSLKALHLKVVKRGNEISIEIDSSEPTDDDFGSVVNMPHTYHGNRYEKAYVPDYITRLYYDENSNTIREYYTMPDVAGELVERGFQYSMLQKQVKNRLFMFPKNDDAMLLVAVPHVDKNNLADYKSVVMDPDDYMDIGGDPYTSKPQVTWRKEPTVDRGSIQTAGVKFDWSGQSKGVMRIHPYIAAKAIMDFDGDQCAVFLPIVEEAKIDFEKSDYDKLDNLKKINYKERTFESLYDKAKRTTYAGNENDMADWCARFNTITQKEENKHITNLGALRRKALLYYKSTYPPETLTIGEGAAERTKEITPEFINKITSVEKIMKMEEPYWEIEAIVYKKKGSTKLKPWSDIPVGKRDLVEDFYFRKKLKQKLDVEIANNALQKLHAMVKDERALIQEHTDRIRWKKSPAFGLKFKIDDGRLLHKALQRQIENSGIEITEEDL